MKANGKQTFRGVVRETLANNKGSFGIIAPEDGGASIVYYAKTPGDWGAPWGAIVEGVLQPDRPGITLRHAESFTKTELRWWHYLGSKLGRSSKPAELPRYTPAPF